MKRRLLSTILGGYRIVYDESDDESYIPVHLHILQLLIYAIMPAIVIIVTKALVDNRKTAVLIGGFVPMGLNLII